MLVVATLPGAEGGFSSLAGVSALFDDPWALLAGWTHYLAFDLFIGGWEVRDAQQRGVRHLLVVPALVLTFLLRAGGPAALSGHPAVHVAGSGPQPVTTRSWVTATDSPAGIRVPPKISHTATNSAAITGPITNPLMPNTASPPRVEISTT